MTRKILIRSCMALGVMLLLASTAAAQTTQQTAGTPTVTTESLSGEVVKVEGNTLVVKMSTGELRTFSNIPESRRATIDGQQVGVRALKPGTQLTATITRTATPVTVRTTTVKTARVWYVAAPTVILTHPDGTNKQYNVKEDVKFTVNGQPATVFELKPGMTVSAEKIVEEEKLELTTTSNVVGTSPAPAAAAASASGSKPAGATSSGSKPPASAASTSGSKPAASAAAPPPPPPAQTGAAPARLPKTGSPIPVAGLLGLLLVGGSLAMRKLRR
jgi:LPXTG-motif cell wall-anchored protein